MESASCNAGSRVASICAVGSQVAPSPGALSQLKKGVAWDADSGAGKKTMFGTDGPHLQELLRWFSRFCRVLA